MTDAGRRRYAELPPAEERTSGASIKPVASRVTVDGGCSHPCFSRDGSLIAFSRIGKGGVSGAKELFVMSPLGGGQPPRQLTYLGESVEAIACAC